MNQIYYPHKVEKGDRDYPVILCDYCNMEFNKGDIMVSIKGYYYHIEGCIYKFFEAVEHDIERLQTDDN